MNKTILLVSSIFFSSAYGLEPVPSNEDYLQSAQVLLGSANDLIKASGEALSIMTTMGEEYHIDNSDINQLSKDLDVLTTHYFVLKMMVDERSHAQETEEEKLAFSVFLVDIVMTLDGHMARHQSELDAATEKYSMLSL